jgi:hypothetical protein
LFLFSISFAQKSGSKDVPKIVKAKFGATFKEVKKVKWNKEKTGYEASFKMGKENKSVTLDEFGKIIDIETEIKVSDLPKDILVSVKKDFAGYKITEAAKIETEGAIIYEAEVTKGKEKMDLIYDGNGNLKNKTKFPDKN